jgi:ABC-type bacteriocin/lantibiotic exporter with double-glycine peptidase domain
MTPLSRFISLLQTQKENVTNIYLYALFNGILNLSIPLGISAIINLIQSASPSTAWWVLVILVLVGLSLAGVFQIYQLVAAEDIQQRIFANASVEFAYRLPRISLSSLKGFYPPELVNRFFDIMTVQKGLSKFLFDFSMAAIQIFFGLLLLAFYHPFFIAFGLAVVAILAVFFRITGEPGLKTSLEESKHKYRLVSWLEEVARNVSTFKMAGHTDLPLKKTDDLSMAYLDARRAHFSVLKRQYISLIVMKVIIAGSLLILGGILVFQQQMNLGQFVAAEIIILLITSSVEKLILSMDTIYDVLTGLEKIGTVTDLDLEETVGVEKLEPTRRGLSIKAQNISVKSYRGSGDILKNIDLQIKAGERIGITGSMGSGKTVMLQLLAGLFDEIDGSLLYDDIPIKHLDLESLRHSIGDNMGQEDMLEASLLENISLSRKGISLEDVKQAIELCDLRTFVEQLPQGMYTQMPASGVGLAQSIRSRVLMARAFVGHHCMLLLEDSWHDIAPDLQEKWIQHLLSSKGQTQVIATNNSDILTRMDRVVSMENGRIKEVIEN